MRPGTQCQPVRTHPLWNPYETPSIDEINAAWVGRGAWTPSLIDVDLTVADSADEDAWLPDLEAAGFVLLVREPDWEEHRVLRYAEPATNLHIFSPGAHESPDRIGPGIVP